MRDQVSHLMLHEKNICTGRT